MNEYDELKSVIRKRAIINDEWDNAIHLCWEEMVSVFSKDMAKTICFLETDCTASEYSWLSEVFESIAEKPQSREFISALRELAVKYTEETEKYNVMSFIDGNRKQQIRIRAYCQRTWPTVQWKRNI